MRTDKYSKKYKCPVKGSRVELREVSKKVILMGDGKVGKTAVVKQFIERDFLEEYTPGTGMTVHSKNLQLAYPNLVINLKLSIYDMCGQKEYSRIRDAGATGADGLVMVGDLTRPETISSIDEFWLKEAKKTIGNLPTAYLGNKLDLVTRGCPTAKLLEESGARTGVPVFLSSAKTGKNIDHVFHQLGEMLVSDLIASTKATKKSRPITLTDALDYIIDDFCAQHGDIEKAMAIAQNQLSGAKVDLNNPKTEAVEDFLERIWGVEEVLLSDHIAKANHDERKAVLNSVSKVR
jgi:small GTP-binding protein